MSSRTRDDRTCLDRERDNIQNVERLHREILHRFKYSVDRWQTSLNFAGSTITLAAILHENTMRTADVPQNEELSKFSGSFHSIAAQYYGKISSLLCLGIANGIIIDNMKGSLILSPDTFSGVSAKVW